MTQESKATFRLPDFALPFVTRALRGGRGKRYMALSGILALLTLVMGTWMALGSGPMERDIRVALDLEDSRWDREETEFVLIADSEEELRDLQRDLDKAAALQKLDRQAFLRMAANPDAEGPTPWPRYSRVSYALTQSYHDLERAARSVPPNRQARELRDRAATMLNLKHQIAVDGVASHYSRDGYDYEWEYEWYSPARVRHVEAMLDANMLPTVERYSSPLSVMGAISFIGALAAWLLAGILLLAAPIATAIAHAREVHQNTLQPLTGTALSPKQLTRGLRAGYLAPLAIFAAPLAVLTVVAALLAGKVLALPFMALALGAGSYAAVSLAQLFAHVTGKRRTPGMIGVGIMSIMGTAALAGMGLGFEADDELMGAIGAVPQAGFTFVQRLTFGNELGFDWLILFSICLGAIAWAVIGGLISRVVAHRIGGMEGPALSRGYAFFGAFVTAGLVVLAYAPIVEFGHVSREEPTLFYYLGLMSLALPYAALVAARVPQSEAPTSMRELPLKSLIAELFGMVAVYTLVTVPLIGAEAFNTLTSPVSAFYAAWGIAVVGLVSVRGAVHMPRSVWEHVGLAWCGLCVFVAGIHATLWALPTGKADAEQVIATWQLSPIIGMLQIVCIFAVPLLLMRSLKQRFAAIK